MKVLRAWQSMCAVIYKIDNKLYFYNVNHNETPSLAVGDEVSAGQLGAPYKVIMHRGDYPEFGPEMKVVDHVDIKAGNKHRACAN